MLRPARISLRHPSPPGRLPQRLRVAAGLAALAVVLAPAVGFAGAPVLVGHPGPGRVPFDRIDHSAWDALLRSRVDADGQVDYRGWHASSADRQALAAYLDRLSQADPQAPSGRGAILAFWINAYNALTVHGILREYPTTSIRNHTARLIGYNVWKDLQIHVGGRPRSLEAIEHEILRKTDEPRIHFAIVCASQGCPRLLNRAYAAADVDRQLEENARDFFSRPQNFRYDPTSGRFQLSAILDWFGGDFGPDRPAQLRAISRWLPDGPAKAAAARGAGSVSFLDYDWNLNERPATAARR